MKILLFSKTPAQVDVYGHAHTLSFSSPLPIETNVAVRVFPLADNLLPFGFVAGKTSKYVKYIAIKDYMLAEIVDFPKVFVPQMFVQKSFAGGMAIVFGTPNVWTISTMQCSVAHSLPSALSAVRILDSKNALFLSGAVEEQNYLAVFHKTSQRFVEFLGSVQFDEKHIRAITPAKTLANHGKLVNAAILQSDVVVEGEDVVYVDGKPKSVPPFLAHIAFFEAVQQKDYELAKTYLAANLQNTLSDGHFEEFFGSFDAVKALRFANQNKIALVCGGANGIATARVFSLQFQNGQIADIQEED